MTSSTDTRTTAEIVADAVSAQVNLQSPGDITFYVDDYCFEFGLTDDDYVAASILLHKRMGFEI